MVHAKSAAPAAMRSDPGEQEAAWVGGSIMSRRWDAPRATGEVWGVNTGARVSEGAVCGEAKAVL